MIAMLDGVVKVITVGMLIGVLSVAVYLWCTSTLPRWFVWTIACPVSGVIAQWITWIPLKAAFFLCTVVCAACSIVYSVKALRTLRKARVKW
jgi:hypothetical protein